MKNFIKGIVLTSVIVSSAVSAEIAVIVNPANTADSPQVSRIFLGKAKSFSNGSPAIPVNLSEASPLTSEFNKKVLNKSSSQLKAYWSKLVFTGKGTPPKAVSSDAEMIKLVSANPNLIGYVDAASVDGSVKVVASF